jgi:hypothetical protein
MVVFGAPTKKFCKHNFAIFPDRAQNYHAGVEERSAGLKPATF